MNILNLYFSQTGNTQKIAAKIAAVLEMDGHRVTTVPAEKHLDLDLLSFDFIFAGSGVYQWLPGKPMLDFLRQKRKENAEQGNIVPCAPRHPNKKAVIYCTYGGVHTGIREAVPAVKFCGQLFDHLGFTIVDEWYYIGDFKEAPMKKLNRGGRMGDISNRPNEQDLEEIGRRARAIVTV